MSESREEIFESTFKALCQHGYADLSIQKIAEESEMSKSSIYYHFDDKEDLMLSFMENMAEQIQGDYMETEDSSPEERLDNLFKVMMGTDEERWQFQKAFRELRLQAQSNEKFAEKLEEADQALTRHIADILEELDVERPEARAQILFSMIEGAVSRKIATQDRKGLRELEKEIRKTVEAWKPE